MACSFTSSLPALIIAAPATAPPSGPNRAPALILPAVIALKSGNGRLTTTTSWPVIFGMAR